jgi:succinyl-CoA synthetase beta subunit
LRLFEYQAKDLFRSAGLTVPRGRVVSSPLEARAAAAELGGRCVVKAQVHVGGRGKAGGVRVAERPDEAEEHARALLGQPLRGYLVERVLVE